MDWVRKLDIYREDFSERLPYEEWAITTMMKDLKPTSQMIGM